MATSLPDERGDYEKFLTSLFPIQISPIEPAPHIAQAINFGNSVGGVVYDLNEYEKGNTRFITNGSEAFMSENNIVFLNINGYSEVGQAIVDNLRSTLGLKERTDVELADYVSNVKIIFRPGTDYSYLFWKQEENVDGPHMILAQREVPGVLPTPSPSVPIELPPNGGASAVNSPSGSITVSTDAIASEIAATLAPPLVQMAHKKDQSQSTGSIKKGGAKASRHEKGETHGSLSSKKGNRPNRNKRKGAEIEVAKKI